MPGRGFYQLEEESLFVQIGQFHRYGQYFSYLESDNFRIDIDREGHPIFLEINLPRRHWTLDSDFHVPTGIIPADIRFLDFRKQITSPEVITCSDRTAILLKFLPADQTSVYYISSNILFEVSPANELASIWITDIIDDFAGQELAHFRKITARQYISAALAI